MVSAQMALKRLVEGNRRYAAFPKEGGVLRQNVIQRDLSRQNPSAIVLGCSDSRVPVEIIFNQGPGDLFVIRVAGPIVAPSQVASVEFAAERFGTRLVVVLGHSDCGAIGATVDEMNRPPESRSKNLKSIVDRIRPSLEGLLEGKKPIPHKKLLDLAVRAHVRASADHLRHGSEILEQLIARDGLRVVGAEYSLQTRRVTFFDPAEVDISR